MDDNKQLLVKLLSAAIRNQEPSQIKIEGVDWTSIYNDAKAHQVHTLLYPVVIRLQNKELSDNELMTKWKRSAFSSGIKQIKHMEKINIILKEFNRMDIPVIALKGIVLRELYPRPELRSMGDADILVHMEDIASASDLLYGMGYFQDSYDDKHIHFSHKTNLAIELHSSLINHTNFKNTLIFENDIWKNALSVKIGDAEALTLSSNDQLLYLCIHMAVHIKSAGFGLRQLCDLVLLVESKGRFIDWDAFYERTHSYGIDSFVQAIFIVCNHLLEMEIPNFQYYKISENNPYINLLIKDIFSGGVFGKSSRERVVANTLLNFSKHKVSYSSYNMMSYFLNFLFPSAYTLGKRYSYAKKRPLLIPIAWLHRFIHFLIRKDLTSSDKKAFLFSLSSEPILEERTKLLKWLDLI